MEGVVLLRVCILGFFCPKQGQGLKPSVAPPNQTVGQVPPPPPARIVTLRTILGIPAGYVVDFIILPLSTLLKLGKNERCLHGFSSVLYDL